MIVFPFCATFRYFQFCLNFCLTKSLTFVANSSKHFQQVTYYHLSITHLNINFLYSFITCQCKNMLPVKVFLVSYTDFIKSLAFFFKHRLNIYLFLLILHRLSPLCIHHYWWQTGRTWTPQLLCYNWKSTSSGTRWVTL